MSDAVGALYSLLKAQAFFVLGIHAIYKIVQSNIELSNIKTSLQTESPLNVVLRQFRRAFGQLGIVALVVLLASVILAGVGYANSGNILVSVPAEDLANGLFQAMVLFFSVEMIYLVMSKWLTPDLRTKPLIRHLVDGLALTGSLVVAISGQIRCMFEAAIGGCGFSATLDYFVYYMFLGVMFIAGLGSIGLVNTITESVTSHVPAKRIRHYLFLLMLGVSLIGLYLVGREVPYFGVQTSVAEAGLELAFIVGLAYFLFSSISNRKIQFSPTLLYVILIISLSGLFLAYNSRSMNIVPDTPVSLGWIDLGIQEAIPLTLFGIGFTGLLIELPKTFEQKLSIDQSRTVPIFTFLLLFSGLGAYQLFASTDLTLSFLTVKDIPAYYGLLAGGVYFTVTKVKVSARKGKLNAKTIVPFCANCGAQTELDSQFCWNCGARMPSEPEKLLYVGNAESIKTIKKRHSARRKLATLVAGGPVGYLVFGRNIELRKESERQVAITNRALYFGGRVFPLNRMTRLEKGHYSNSIILDVETPSLPRQSGSESAVRSETSRLDRIELKSNDIETVSRIIGEAVNLELPQPA